ncbi:MAG: Polypeptide-transport-associated domain protein FtsQ-type [Actinobacteria bacterium 66_15]|nr:MAG: Polypeptide-transport-associated domain protein FtsQ-type [Actinobacteria bacterium 66_15]
MRDSALPPHVNAKKVERERRKIARQRSALKRAALVAAALVVVVGSWVALLDSPSFTIEEIRVEGISELSEQEVVAIAAVDEDATLLNIDADGVIERLRQVPWVAEADIVRLFPSTLLISVEERERFAMVDAGVTFWSVDRAGRVLGESIPDTSTSLPVIRDVVQFEPVAGEVTGSEAVKNALAVLKGISPELLEMTAMVSAPSPEETALLTEANVEVMLGRAEQLTEKSALALQIMREQGSGVVFIDVRSLERPISRGITD